MRAQTVGFGLGVLLVTVALDVSNSKSVSTWSRKHRIARLLTWMPAALSYATLYLGRYNLAAINVPAVRDLIGLQAVQLGTVAAVGMWSYSLTAPCTGRLVTLIGPWQSLMLGVAGAGMANLCVLPLITLQLSGWALTGGLCGCYSLNMILQGSATAACPQLISTWYNTDERGLFSGIFNTWIVRTLSSAR